MVMATMRPDHRKVMPVVVVRQRKLLRRKDGVFSCTSKLQPADIMLETQEFHFRPEHGYHFNEWACVLDIDTTVFVIPNVQPPGVVMMPDNWNPKQERVPMEQEDDEDFYVNAYRGCLALFVIKIVFHYISLRCDIDAENGSEFLILSAYAPSMPPLLLLPLFMACDDSDGLLKKKAIYSVEPKGIMIWHQKDFSPNQAVQEGSKKQIKECVLYLSFGLTEAEIAENAIVAEAGAFKETYVIYRALISEFNHNDVIQTVELVIRSVGEGVGGLMNSNLQDDEVGDGTTSMVSPTEYGHVLLIPRILERLPERIDYKILFLRLYVAPEAASPYFHLYYNDLGTFAIHLMHYWLINTYGAAAARSAWERLFSRYHRICLLSAGPKKGIAVVAVGAEIYISTATMKKGDIEPMVVAEVVVKEEVDRKRMTKMSIDTKRQSTPVANAGETRTQLAEKETQAQSTKSQQFQNPSTELKKQKRRLKDLSDVVPEAPQLLTQKWEDLALPDCATCVARVVTLLRRLVRRPFIAELQDLTIGSFVHLNSEMLLQEAFEIGAVKQYSNAC
ncbi:GDP-L-galactose phosphorylase 1 [Tanacetum coccineum]|uniref:GDP-L-galactose phosphorylase 1 n=1 Tax=Tanacetum coccineum TaxID=301880 RepID=A0ABQ5ID44_9ASTR